MKQRDVMGLSPAGAVGSALFLVGAVVAILFAAPTSCARVLCRSWSGPVRLGLGVVAGSAVGRVQR